MLSDVDTKTRKGNIDKMRYLDEEMDEALDQMIDGEMPTTDAPSFDRQEGLGTPFLFIFYLALLAIVIGKMCLQRYKEAQRRSAVLELVESTRRELSISHHDVPRDLEDISNEAAKLCRQILLEHFKTKGIHLKVSKDLLQKITPSDGDKEDGNKTADDIEEGLGGNFQLKISDGKRKLCVPGGCAICLQEYAIDESIVWASNTKCPHVYHENCLVEYLSKLNVEKLNCPSCRQQFCILEDPEKEVYAALSGAQRWYYL